MSNCQPNIGTAGVQGIRDLIPYYNTVTPFLLLCTMIPFDNRNFAGSLEKHKFLGATLYMWGKRLDDPQPNDSWIG